MYGRTFIVVEDEPITAMYVQLQLEEAGASNVAIAGSVASALRLLSNENVFDLAIVDLHLRDGDASSLIHEFTCRAIPVLVTTGGAITTTETDLSQAGAVLVKPYAPAAFMAVVKRLVTADKPAS